MPDTATATVWTLIAAWLIKELWPFVKDRLYPDLTAARKDAQTSERELLDRVIVALDNNTRAMTTIQLMGESQAHAGERTADAIQKLAKDIEGLREQLRLTQPQRQMAAGASS